jgi:AbrB family looped-hinge helix DNA binding protein
MTDRSTVSEKGQVTIPKRLRDRLGIRPGQVLDFHEERGRLVATKRAAEDAVAVVYGILGSDRSTDHVMGDLRGEPDAV